VTRSPRFTPFFIEFFGILVDLVHDPGFVAGTVSRRRIDRVARQTSAFMPGKDSADGKAVLEF